MRFRTGTKAKFLGLFCFLGLLLFIDGIVSANRFNCLFGLATLLWVAPFFIFCLNMLGNIYCSNHKIIMERGAVRKENSLNENLKIQFGIFSIKMVNENTIYLDRENDKNNVMANIYGEAQKNIQNRTMVFPFLYRKDSGVKRNITVDNDKIEVENFWGRKSTIYNNTVNNIEILHLVTHQLVLHISYESRKIIIPLNQRVS